MPYKESKEFLRDYQKYDDAFKSADDVEEKLLQFVLSSTPAGQPQAILQEINRFCRDNWMMNIGEDKGEILKMALKKYGPKSILELGGYCGFSALLMAAHSEAVVHSVEPNQKVAAIARRIHQHAGLAERIAIHIGTVQSEVGFIAQQGQFDLVFIDHVKHLYLPDLQWLEQVGAVRCRTVVVADNILYPGCPDYLHHLQLSSEYDSTLYHSYLEYSNYRDAVLISERIAP